MGQRVGVWGLAVLVGLLGPVVEVRLGLTAQSEKVTLPNQLIAKKKSVREAEANQLLKTGHQQYKNQQYQKAWTTLQQSLLIFRKIESEKGESYALLELAKTYRHLAGYKLERYRELLSDSFRAIEHIEENEEKTKVRERIRKLILDDAIFYGNSGYEQDGIASLQYFIPFLNRIGDRYGEAEALQYLGHFYLVFGQNIQSLDAFEKALLIYQDLGARDKESFLWKRLGDGYKRVKKSQLAIHSYNQAVYALGLGEWAEKVAILSTLKELYLDSDNLSKAIQVQQKISDLIEKNGELKEKMQSYLDMSALYRKDFQFEKALRLYEKGIELDSQNKEKLLKLTTSVEICSTYIEMGKAENAFHCHQKFLKKIAHYSKQKTSFLIHIGDTYLKHGFADKAYLFHSQAIQLLSQQLSTHRHIIPVNDELAKIEKIGVAYQDSGNPNEALLIYRRIFKIMGRIAPRYPKASSFRIIRDRLVNLSLLLQKISIDKSHKEEALKLYYEFIEFIREKDKESQSLSVRIEVLEALGSLYMSFKEFDRAKQSCVDINSALPMDLGSYNLDAHLYRNLGDLCLELNKIDVSIRFHRAWSMLRISDGMGGNVVEYHADAVRSLASTYFVVGAEEQAKVLFQESFKLEKSWIKDGWTDFNEITIIDKIKRFNVWGFEYQNHEQYNLAASYFYQALALGKLLQQGEERIEEESLDLFGKTYANTGYLLASQGQTETAILFYKSAISSYEKIRKSYNSGNQSILGTRRPDDFFIREHQDDYKRLADLLLQQNRILEAQRVLDLLKVQELDDYLSDVRSNTAPGSIPNLQPEKLILSGIEDILAQTVPIGQELTRLRAIKFDDRTEAQKQRISQLEDLQQKITQDFNDFLASAEVQDLIAQLNPETRDPDLADEMARLLSVQPTLANADPNAVLLYPLILEDRIELILTTANAKTPPRRHTINVSQAELRDTIQDFRAALQDPSRDPKPAAQKLYNWLLKDFEADLATVEAKTILYAPDGLLRYVPLAALHDGEDWLVQNYRINNITAASLQKLTPQPPQEPSILAGAFATGQTSFSIGDEQFNFRGLPFTKVEVENIGKLIPDTVQLVDQAFNAEDTTNRMGDHNIIHLATHGAIVIGSPDDSFILFGDNEDGESSYATVREVQNWNLNGTDLVVLSACETGLGGQFANGEEILGLGYQFQRAGAKATIASLWQVDDGGTQQLMTAFYNALNSGMTKAEALQQAQLALIDSDNAQTGDERASLVAVSDRPSQTRGALSHPYYWAPFILIGNGL